MSCGNLAIALAEEGSTNNFIEIAVSPKLLKIEKTKDKCKITGDGVTISTIMPFSFTSYFIKVMMIIILANCTFPRGEYS